MERFVPYSPEACIGRARNDIDHGGPRWREPPCTRSGTRFEGTHRRAHKCAVAHEHLNVAGAHALQRTDAVHRYNVTALLSRKRIQR
jgi:hypothetical protein